MLPPGVAAIASAMATMRSVRRTSDISAPLKGCSAHRCGSWEAQKLRTRVASSQRVETFLRRIRMERHESTTSFWILLAGSLCPQRTLFATRANYEILGNDKRLAVELPVIVAS